MKSHFYQKGVDISNNRSMFEFLNNHHTYPTMNSWNGTYSISNKVKVYSLNLSGDPWVALAFLQRDDWAEVNAIIRFWETKHPGYSVGFNGRSGGYLVLYNEGNCRNILPEELTGYDSYEEWKADVRDYGYLVSDFHQMLRTYTKLVQDFDKLCDELREYCDSLSQLDIRKDTLELYFDIFTDEYAEDLEFAGIELKIDDQNRIDITEICKRKALYEALRHTLRSDNIGLELVEIEEGGKVFITYKD